MRRADMLQVPQGGPGAGSFMDAVNKPERKPLAPADGFGAVFMALRKLLKRYESELAVKTDKPGNCYLETRSTSLNGRRMFFAAAKIKKNYVSFYLIPLFMFPDLSQKISPTLRRLMQGQSCFNLTTMDQDCLDELDRLTQAGFQKLKSEALL
jgi:hypothetical protein